MAELYGIVPLRDPMVSIKDDDDEQITITMSWERAKKIEKDYNDWLKELEEGESLAFCEILEILTENGIYFPELVHLWELGL